MKIELEGTPNEVRNFLYNGAMPDGNIVLTPFKKPVDFREIYEKPEIAKLYLASRYSKSKKEPIPIRNMDTNHIVNSLAYEFDTRKDNAIYEFENNFILRALIYHLAKRIEGNAVSE